MANNFNHEQLLAVSDAFFVALATNTPPLRLLSYFSTTHPVVIQHAPSSCPNPRSSRLSGLNAIRSYFDILATHWTRTNMHRHSIRADPALRRVVVSASVTWMWKKSGRKWNEDFTCTLDYDEGLKIVSFIVTTESGTSTCVMRAVDAEPVLHEKSSIQVSVREVCSQFPGPLPHSHLRLSLSADVNLI